MPFSDVVPFKILKSVDVHLALGEDSVTHVLSATPQEAFSMLTMPVFAGSVVKLVPNYELPEMSEKED